MPSHSGLFPAEVGRDFTPFRGFPFDDGVSEIMGVKPVLGSGDNLIELFCLRCALQFCLALALLYPEDGIIGVAVDGLIVQALIPA